MPVYSFFCINHYLILPSFASIHFSPGSEWYSSGEEVTPEQQQEIPPITAIETPSGAMDGQVIETVYMEPDTEPVVETAPFDMTEYTEDTPDPVPESTVEDPITEATTTEATTTTTTSFTTTPFVPIVTIAPYEIEGELFADSPLEVLDEPALVVGGVVDDVIAGTDTNPINGGVILDPASESTPEGSERLAEVINAPTVIESAGPRVLEPFNCAGLNGFDCCLLIKKTVTDSDVNGKSIQCFLDYDESTCKKEWWREILEVKRVMIYENDLGFVNQLPIVEGAWPSCTEKWGNTTERDWTPPTPPPAPEPTPPPTPTPVPTPNLGGDLPAPSLGGDLPAPSLGGDPTSPSIGGDPTSLSTGGDSPSGSTPISGSSSPPSPPPTTSGCEGHLAGPTFASLPMASDVCPNAWLPNFAYQGGDMVQAKSLVFKCKGSPGTSCFGGLPGCEPCHRTSSTISWESKWQLVGKCDKSYTCPAVNQKNGLADKYNTKLYSVITKGNLETAAKIHHTRVYVGGALINPGTPTPIQVKGGSFFGSVTGQFSFTGGHKKLRDTPPPLDFGYYEHLARNLVPGVYSGGFEVIVKKEPKTPAGACYTTTELTGEAYTTTKNGKTLVVFAFSGDICLTKSSTEAKFGPTILAPFANVTIGMSAGGVAGLVIAKNIVVQNNLHEVVGHAYNGPLFCSKSAKSSGSGSGSGSRSGSRDGAAFENVNENGFNSFGKYVGFAN